MLPVATTNRRPTRVAKRDQAVRRLSRRARTLLPWIEDADASAVRAWAELEVLAREAYAKLREQGILNDAGEPRALTDVYQRLRKSQLAFEKELGMTPAARTALKANGRRTDYDLAAAMSQAEENDAVEP
jgi:phage terminase small subunit